MIGLRFQSFEMAPNRNTPRRPGCEPIVNERSFVFSDGPHKTSDREVRRQIRANAMRDYWRRRRLETKSVSDNGSTQSRGVTFEDSPCDLGYDEPARVSWPENGQQKLSSGLVEATVESTDCSSREMVKKVAAECPLLPSHAATQTAHATHPQKRDTGKNEVVFLNESSISNLSFNIGNGMIDPFNASALEGSRRDSFILSHRKYLSFYAMPKSGKDYILQGYNTD